jgi:methyl-accepting chemotaxis protein
VNPLLLPPRLMLRALEDLHTLALAAARLERVEERLNERADAIIAMGDQMDERAERILEMGEQIVAMGARIAEVGEKMDARTDAILAQGERIEAAAREVADRGAELAAALPVMQRAIEMAEPLEGVVERLGRVADRLPGGQRGRAPGR